MNCRKCEVCNINVHRASYAKHLRSKYLLENEKHNELIIPEWLFKKPIGKKIQIIYNPKSLKQIARDKNKLDDKRLNKELAQNIINPYYFTHRKLKMGFKINLDTHHINQANSKLTKTPNYPEFGVEVRYINKIIKNYLYFLHQDLINKMKIIKY